MNEWMNRTTFVHPAPFQFLSLACRHIFFRQAFDSCDVHWWKNLPQNISSTCRGDNFDIKYTTTTSLTVGSSSVECIRTFEISWCQMFMNFLRQFVINETLKVLLELCVISMLTKHVSELTKCLQLLTSYLPMLFKKHMLTDPIDFWNNYLKKTE